MSETTETAEKAPGLEHYTPSRLEWLAFTLNSFSTILEAPYNGKIKSIYMPKNDGKTLTLMVAYPKDSDLKKVDLYIERIKKIGKTYVSDHQWDSWLEIEVEHIPM